MTGIDIVKINRFEDISDAFMQRIFTEREREYLVGKKAQSSAGMFAAKEAVAKALGTGFCGFSPRDIEILHKENGKPFAVLHNNAKKTAKAISRPYYRFRICISISHTDTDSVAVAQIL